MNYHDLLIKVNNRILKFDIYPKKIYADLIIPHKCYHSTIYKMQH